MGEVYRAYDERLERPLAVKHVFADKAGEESYRERFRREARAVARLNHPAIVQIHDIVESEDGDWIVMELVEGQNLRGLLSDGPLPAAQVLHLGQEIAHGLAEAHRHGIVHRDLKTENVMVNRAGHAKILDFGLAKQTLPGRTEPTLSEHGMLLGTVRAMSPEQAMGYETDSRSDLFSLGTLLYEMITGESPFMAENPSQTLARVLSLEQKPARSLNPDVPPGLSELIDRLLEKDPDHRPQSAEEVAAGLAGMTGTSGQFSAPAPVFRPEDGEHTEQTPTWARATVQQRFSGVSEALSSRTVASDPVTAVTEVARPEAAAAVEGTAGMRGAGRWLALALLLGLVAVAVVLVLFVDQGEPVEVESVRSRPSVSVLGFKNTSGKGEIAWLSTAFSEMLRTELAAGGELRLISGESVARMKIELDLPEADTLARDTLERVRCNLDTDYVVLGSFLAVGNTVRLDFRLQDTVSGDTVTASSTAGEEADLFSIAAQAGFHLRGELGLEAPSHEEVVAARASTSSSSEATALYAKALVELRRYDAQAARELLAQAIEVDPGYALAHAALSEVWVKLGYDRRAEVTAAKAFELAEEKDLPRESVLLIEGRYHEAAGAWPKAIDTYRLLWQFFPDNVDYGLRLAGAQGRAGLDQDSLATVEALRAVAGTDVRIDLTEAEAAHNVADYRRALAAAERAAEKARARDAKVLLAEALLMRGTTLRRLGRLDEAGETLVESRDLFTRIGDEGKAARATNTYANVVYDKGDLDGAERLLREALATHESTGDRKAGSTASNNLANLYRQRGKLEVAQQMLEQSLAVVREIGDKRREPNRLNNLGWVALERGDLEKARQWLEQVRKARRAHGSKRGLAADELLSGRIAFVTGDLNRARTHHDEALRICEEIEAPRLGITVLTAMSELLLARGELEEVRRRLDGARQLQSELEKRGGQGRIRLAEAALLFETGRLEEAQELAREARLEFLREGRLDDEISAGAMVVRCLVAQSRLDAAGEVLEDLVRRAGSSERPAVRIEVSLGEAELAAVSGRPAAALRVLEEALAEARRFGFVDLELEVRLALGESTGDGAALDALAREAGERGFALIARKAGAG